MHDSLTFPTLTSSFACLFHSFAYVQCSVPYNHHCKSSEYSFTSFTSLIFIYLFLANCTQSKNHCFKSCIGIQRYNFLLFFRMLFGSSCPFWGLFVVHFIFVYLSTNTRIDDFFFIEWNMVWSKWITFRVKELNWTREKQLEIKKKRSSQNHWLLKCKYGGSIAVLKYDIIHQNGICDWKKKQNKNVLISNCWTCRKLMDVIGCSLFSTLIYLQLAGCVRG